MKICTAVVLCLALCVYAMTVNGQVLVKDDVYPVLKTYKKTEKYYGASLNFSGCVEGNCLNGQGTAMLMHNGSSKSETGKNETSDARIFLWKGNFSDSGRLFIGRSYDITVTYEGNKERSSSKYTPQAKFDFSKEESLKNYMTAEGSGVKTVIRSDGSLVKYMNEGYVKDHVRRKWSTAFQSYEGVYKKGIPEKVTITYTPNDVINKYTGSIAYTGEFLLGRAEYTDGSRYDGAFYDNKFYGPGIYTGKDGKKLQGLWQNGVLTIPKEIVLPEYLFSLQPAKSQTGTTVNFNLGVRNASGIYTGDTKNGMPEGNGFMSINDGFYAGSFLGGKPHGSGYFYESANPKEQDTYRTVKYESMFTGTFTGGWLTHGTYIFNKIEQKAGDEGPFTNDKTYLSRGTFVKHRLEGCGFYNEVNHTGGAYDYEIEGFFVNNMPSGWAYVKTNSQNRAFKPGLEYIRHGQYESIYGTYFYDSVGSAESLYRKVALDTQSRCAGTQEERMAYMAEMQKAIVRFKEKLAHQKAVAAALAAAAARCKERTDKALFRPNTVVSKQGRDAVVMDYDCVKESYLISWVTDGKPFENNYSTLTATEMRDFVQSSNRYTSCGACMGKGGKMITYDVSTTKELPFGYFSGIRTTITKTVKEQSWEACKKCSGKGYIKN